MWWDTLDDNPNINKGNWANIQREFMAAYAPRFISRTTYTNFQRKKKNVQDYYIQVSDALKKMCRAKPAMNATVRGATTAEHATAIKLEGVKDL